MNVSVADTEHEEAHPALWLLTFADLTAILVALFVLMYSMSSPFVGKGRGALAGGVADTPVSTPDRYEDRSEGHSERLAILTLGYISAVFSDRGIAVVAQRGESVSPVTQSIDADRLVLRVASDFAFSSGDKTLRPAAAGVMADIAAILSSVANPVSVFTEVPDNDWALAFDRADDVVGAFRRFGYAAPIERFVTPGISGEALVIVIGRAGGAGS